MEAVKGLSGLKGAAPSVQEICKTVKQHAEAKSNITFPVFYPILYRERILPGGQHYYMKVHVSESSDEYVHVHVGRAICTGTDPHDFHFSGIQTGKTLHDPIDDFRHE